MNTILDAATISLNLMPSLNVSRWPLKHLIQEIYTSHIKYRPFGTGIIATYIYIFKNTTILTMS